MLTEFLLSFPSRSTCQVLDNNNVDKNIVELPLSSLNLRPVALAAYTHSLFESQYFAQRRCVLQWQLRPYPAIANVSHLSLPIGVSISLYLQGSAFLTLVLLRY